ncbi:MAG: polysaccharide pyruvyl transferase family protein [Acidobacteriia bacterium]|nr:polysaccharide pyruvyl transferase family protein [Terriglobia bacterium]
MKFGAFTYGYSTNLGDEIQTLSATQFLPSVDVLIERDRLHWYRNCSPVFVIFNGWFTHQPSWPPPDSIFPLFVSFHAEMPGLLVDKRFVSYFKRHEPIGCRSLATLKAFRDIGVDAYFSGCLTLTLEREQRARTNQIYAVDVEPKLYANVVPGDIKERAVHVSHEYPPLDATLLTKAKWKSAHLGLRSIYKWEWGRSLLSNAGERLSELRHSSRTARARELLTMYSSAKVVITSRLHCALPCLALGTPVLLLRSGVELDPRFAGLRELVRFHSDPSRPIKIDWQDPEPNPDKYLGYAKALRERCEDAVSRVMKFEGATHSVTCGTGAG